MIGDANIRKARKAHRCNWCGERICAGEFYDGTDVECMPRWAEPHALAALILRTAKGQR